jgi:hypothetical protein
MKEQLRQQLLTEFPKWHLKPLRLSIVEIDNPASVLDFFFTCYDLPDLRACLKEMLHDSLRAEGADAASHVSTHRDLEKLVEAVWVIHNQNNNNTSIKKQGLSHNKIKPEVEEIENVKLVGSYRNIREFFESFTLPEARNYLSSVLKAAESKHIWNDAAPTDLLYFFESMEALLSATYSIIKEGNKIKKVILPKSPDACDLTQYHLYCGHYNQLKPWDYFPRMLSAKEYRDPYKALQNFTSWAPKKEWKMNLRYLLSYSLGASSLSDLGVNLELVRISEHLQKMLEACHLIYVRTIQPPKI